MAIDLPVQSRWLIRAVALVTGGLLLAAAVGIWLLRNAAIEDAQNENHRLGVVIAEQTTRAFQSVDLVLQELGNQVVASGVHDPASFKAKFGSLDFHDILAKKLINLPQTESFVFVDAHGRMVNGSRLWPPSSISLADRDYFHELSSKPGTDPYVSRPAHSRASGAQVVFLARRLTAGDGTFLGVMLAPIRLDYFVNLFARSGFTDGRGVTLLRRDGTVLVHFPAGGVPIGARIDPGLKWYDLVATGGGMYRSPGAFGRGLPMLVSANPLSLYPIVVDVTRDEEAALARWRGQCLWIWGGASIFTFSLILLINAIGRQIILVEESRRRISEQAEAARASEARLAAQSKELETTLAHMEQGIVMADADGVVRVCNQRAVEMLDLPADILATHPRVSDVIRFQLERGDLAEAPFLDGNPGLLLSNKARYERRAPNGSVIEIRTSPLAGGGLVRTYTDITARATAEEMLGLAASRDYLTGLPNRNGFCIALENTLSAARRDSGDFAVLCLDLDGFKAINDRYGHAAGDQMLVIVAQRLNDVIRTSDMIGRLGGDEFAVVLTALSQDGAEYVCERILDTLRLPYRFGDNIARISVSIGMAIYPGDGDTADHLMHNADVALYKAKAGGRDTWRAFANVDGEREHLRMLLEQDMRGAIEARQFTLSYQPISECASGEVFGFEALLRWNHPVRGAVSPGEFIPIAETTGLIIPLGRWVIETACAEAAAWALPLHLAVNLSPAQFRDRDLVGFIGAVLQRTGLSAGRLELEVTEGLLLDNSGEVIQTMQALRAMGIRLVLDDFGTAHSNLSYLCEFPFDAVKIDRSFLRALSTEPQSRALVEAILAMARALGLDVVGEGVETPEQLTLLRHLKCRWVQGYLLGKPAPGAETRDYIWKLAADHIRSGRALAGPHRTGADGGHADADQKHVTG